MLAGKLLVVGVAILGLGGMACGGTVDVNDTGGGGEGGSGGEGGDGGATVTTGTTGGGGDGAGGGAAGGAGGAGGTLPEGFCPEACAVTSQDGCFPTSACEEYCLAEGSDWTAEVGAAFAKCAAENPLCFETVEGCILSELHPPGSKNIARLKGTGFDAHDGKVFRVWHDPDTGVQFGGEVVITGGELAFEWNEPFAVWDGGGPLLLLYIDMDGDGACEAAADLTGTASPSWNGDYLEPVYEATVSPPLNDPDFVCDFTP